MGDHYHRSLLESARSRLVHVASTFRQRARWVSESPSGAYRDARSSRVGGGGRNERNEKSEEGERERKRYREREGERDASTRV